MSDAKQLFCFNKAITILDIRHLKCDYNYSGFCDLRAFKDSLHFKLLKHHWTELYHCFPLLLQLLLLISPELSPWQTYHETSHQAGHAARLTMAEIVYSETCLERQPVLKGHIFLAEGATFQ